MKKTVVVALLLVCLMALGVVCVRPVKAQYQSDIVINADGSVTPSTAPIQRDGNLYRLTVNLYDSPVVVLRNNIVIDGEGFVLQGAGGWGVLNVAGLEASCAINLTCSNVTVRNFNINGWEVGILGSYNGNTITNNNITETERAIAIYADNYNVTGNYLANSVYGVRIQGNNDNFQQNQIVNNFCGFLISSSLGVIIVENKIANNSFAVNIDNFSSYQIYLNDFIANAMILEAYTSPFVVGIALSPWDNGKEGNYWSDYAIKYPGAAEVDDSGIGDTPYLVFAGFAVYDRYPLIKPVTIQNIETTSPKISILSPLNQKYNDSSVPLVFTANEAVNWTGYSLDGQQNVTITGNTTIANVANGLHSITVYANDTFGEIGASQTVNFTIAKPEPFPTETVAAVSVAVAVAVVVVAGLLVYFKKRKRKV